LIRVACAGYKRGREAGICEMEVELELTRRHRLQGDMCLVESCPGIKKCAIPIFNGQNLLHLPPLDPLCRCKKNEAKPSNFTHSNNEQQRENKHLNDFFQQIVPAPNDNFFLNSTLQDDFNKIAAGVKVGV
jgi:hypothetical protein